MAGLRSSDGRTPSRSQILLYEAEMRKHAYRYMRAMVMLRIWPKLWGKHAKRQTSSLHISLCPSPSVRLRLQPSRLFRSMQAWERPKGKGKGKGKNNDENDRFGLPIIKKHLKSANGKPLCFDYGKPKGCTCTRSDCQFQHACQRCFGSHPYWQCPAVKRSEKADSE